MRSAGTFLFIAGLAGLAAGASAAVSHLAFPMRDTRFTVETVIDRGLVKELLVSCLDARESVVRHAPLDQAWCDDKNVCHRTLDAAVRASCA